VQITAKDEDCEVHYDIEKGLVEESSGNNR
jgi:hypothetical protein